MRNTDATRTIFERLADALSADLLRADVAEIEDSHPGRAARVQADAVRQALRRAAASAPAPDRMPRDVLRRPTMRPSREDKR